MIQMLSSDSEGNRTPDSSVRGQRLDRLTTEPYYVRCSAVPHSEYNYTTYILNMQAFLKIFFTFFLTGDFIFNLNYIFRVEKIYKRRVVEGFSRLLILPLTYIYFTIFQEKIQPSEAPLFKLLVNLLQFNKFPPLSTSSQPLP